ncbi:MAG: IS481 family transposase [Candidatus Dormibacteraeota bacterium]|nr:IS481 family transposase [Candidatus Dormibacteraeota bacterium]
MSSLGRYIVDAVVLEHRSPTELARDHHISRRWIHKLVKRFKEGGYSSLAPRSRRPHSCSHQTPSEVQTKVVRLRQELVAAGHDAGPDTIAHHLIGQVDRVPSVATVWRILKRNGLIAPQPHKRPKSSFIRFEAQLPNETWQLDSTPWQLADGSPVEILNFLDDKSRVALASKALVTVKSADPVHALYSASNTFGLPASLLSDNAAVFTGRSRRGKVLLELELERLGIVFKHSTPYHPQTCGKVERFHQTLKRFLRKQHPASSIAELQFQLDAFRNYYNNRRPHRALNRQTPLAVFNALIKAKPAQQPAPVDHRVRHDKIDSFGRVTLRYLGRLHHIPVGLAHKNRKVRLLVAGPDIRIITETGELLRALTLDPTRNYQPLGGRWPAHNVLPQAGTMS